jgi:fucokinase
VIAFTGIERLAKNVLQIVVGRYLSRDGRVLTAIADLVDLAHEGRGCFAAGDIDGVGRVMGQAWDVHQVLDPHCGNVAVDTIFDRIDDLCLGIKLAGAGGGGFLGAMATAAEAAEAAERARARLREMGGGLSVYDWSLFRG